MTSQKQIDANRRNALKSTGPRTAEGKSAVRLNALKHGLRARVAVTEHEDAAAFHQLCADLEADWQPRNRTEQLLVEEMAISHWKLSRAEALETRVITENAVTKEQMGLIGQLSQYQARLHRAFYKAMRELQNLQKTALPESPAQPAEAAEAHAAAAPPQHAPVAAPFVVPAPPAEPSIGFDGMENRPIAAENPAAAFAG